MASNTIGIKLYSENYEDALAGEAITPGMLVERTSTGTFVKQITTSIDCERMFAMEDDNQGHGISDDYDSGSRVHCIHAYSGDTINALLSTASNIAIGDFLESAGSGLLKEYSSGVKIAVAVEAVNPSVAGTHYAVKIL